MSKPDVAMSSGDPAVAVVITCFNEGPYIGAAVRSVLSQTREDIIESIVIADDGSQADTIAVLRDMEHWDPRIRVIYGTGGAGLPAQRNLAISCTRAPFFAILDGDDIWTTDKLERQLPELVSDSDVGLVYAGYWTFASDDLANAHRAAVRDITAESDLTRAYFMNDPPIIPSTTLIRRSTFESCGGFDATIRVFEDTDLYLRLSRVCRFAFVAAPLLYKRSRTSSITGGRKDLMAYHALVALKAAADDEGLLALVPQRLAERARKLGNHYFLLGKSDKARPILRFSMRLDPTNMRAWFSWVVVAFVPRIAHALMASRWKSRRTSMGIVDKNDTPEYSDAVSGPINSTD